MMCSYNPVNGVLSYANKLSAAVVRGQWGFNGRVTSDCNAIRDFYSATGHLYSPDTALASTIAVLAGTDTDCGRAYLVLPQAVKEGLISERDINVAAKRLFMVRFRLGMFDPAGDVSFDQVPYGAPGMTIFWRSIRVRRSPDSTRRYRIKAGWLIDTTRRRNKFAELRPE